MRQSSIVSASVFTCSDSGKWRHSSLLQQSALLPQSKRVLGSNPSRISSWVCAFCVGSPGPLASSHSPKLTSSVNGCLSWICRWAWHGALGLAADSSQLHKVQFCLPPPLPRPKPPLILHPSLPLPLFFPWPAINYWLMSALSSHHNFAAVCIPPPHFLWCWGWWRRRNQLHQHCFTFATQSNGTNGIKEPMSCFSLCLFTRVHLIADHMKTFEWISVHIRDDDASVCWWIPRLLLSLIKDSRCVLASFVFYLPICWWHSSPLPPYFLSPLTCSSMLPSPH